MTRTHKKQQQNNNNNNSKNNLDSDRSMIIGNMTYYANILIMKTMKSMTKKTVGVI